MYGSGIDFIQCDAAGSNPGMIQAANEGDNRVVIGTSLDTASLGPKTMQASVVIGFGLSLYNQVNAALDPSFKGGHYLANMKDGVIDFVLSPVFLKEGKPEEIAAAKRSGRKSRRRRPTSSPARLRSPSRLMSERESECPDLRWSVVTSLSNLEMSQDFSG